MKHIFFSLLLIIISINNVVSQNSKIIYKKKFLQSKDTTYKVKNKISSILENAYKKVDEFEYILIFNNDESFFKIDESLEIDDNSTSYRIAKELGGGNGVSYMNNKEKKIIQQREIGSDVFLIDSKFNKFKWKLTDEKRIIGKYLCLKATTSVTMETIKGSITKKVVAWFSPKIPVPFGPDGYGGLPGLILELQVGNMIFHVQRAELNSKEQFQILSPKKGIKVSKKEYDNIEKNGFNKFKKN